MEMRPSSLFGDCPAFEATSGFSREQVSPQIPITDTVGTIDLLPEQCLQEFDCGSFQSRGEYTYSEDRLNPIAKGAKKSTTEIAP
jgi:hypothetical protein